MAGAGNSINETTTGICGFTGTAFVGTPVTNHNLIIGGSTSSTLTNVAPSATSGVPVISQGSSSDPAFGTAVVAGGGTGDTSFTAYAVVCGGTTSTGALQNVSGVGSSTNVLTSSGAGALPTWAAAPSGNVSQVTVTLTSAQIKALHATPIQIIAAPGAGTVINVINAWSKYTYGGTNVFVAGAAQIIELYYGTATVSITPMISNSNLTGTNSVYRYQSDSNITGVSLASVENVAINAYNAVATEISGNAANNNTLTITVFYTTFAI